MNLNSRKKHLLLLFLYFLSIYFPGSLCQSGQEYVTCSQTFQCANITNISYPFWGGRRPPYCGHPGFGLNCQGDVPTLATSPLSYRVLEIDFSTYTLKVAREDLWNITCPAVLHDTTLNPRLFEIPPDSNCKNVTLYFDCTSNGAQPQQRTLPNQFPCGSNETINLFKTGDVASGPGADFTCNQNISVPVNEDGALALENPNTSSISVLRAALASGFSIQWSADNANCVRSAGACGYNSNLGSTVRYSSRQMGVSPAPTPVAYKRDEGNPTFYALGTSATDPGQDPDPDPGPGQDPDPDPGPGQDPDPDPGQGQDPDPDPGPGQDPDPDPGPGQDPDPDPGPGQDPDPDPDPDPGPEPDPDPEPGPDPDPDPDPGQDQDITPVGSSPTLPPTRESPEYRPRGIGIAPVGSPLAPPPGTTYFPTRSHIGIRIMLGLIVGGIGIIIVAFYLIYWCCTRWCSPKGPINPNVEKFLLQQGSLALRRYRYSEIKKITKSFNDKLGQGGFGSVYKGMLPDGCHVAVKVLVEMDNNGEEFFNEVASISRTSHVNIVNLLGFCYERNKRALVFEYMPNRSLDKFINKDENIDYLDMEKLFKIAVGVAKGLEYLHMGCNTRIVHFDIKPQNILLDEDFRPKISDFGLAKLCKKKQSILSVFGTRGTIGYIAPEVFFRNFGGVSHRSDVYSYGMMVLKMVGAKNMVETKTIQSGENYFPDKIYEQVILAGTRNVDDSIIEEEDERARKIYLVGFWCIQTIPSDRPSMSRVVEMLEGSLQSIQIPPKPFLFDPNLSGHEFSLETENSTEGFLEDV